MFEEEYHFNLIELHDYINRHWVSQVFLTTVEWSILGYHPAQTDTLFRSFTSARIHLLIKDDSLKRLRPIDAWEYASTPGLP